MILSDAEIIQRSQDKNNPMISPLHEATHKVNGQPVVSYGVSSYGYDIRLGRDFKLFTNAESGVIDPKNVSEGWYVDRLDQDSLVIPPGGFALAASSEYYRIPRDIMVVCVGKSTYARCGIVVHVTPLEPEWEGQITIEISNTAPLPARVYGGEGIAQLLFLKASNLCAVSYLDREGRYQGQRGVTLPRMISDNTS